ncbi:MAG: sulfur carrier protein ThiS [Bacillota bacterium]
MAIKVILNGREEALPEGITVSGLVSLKGISPDTVIVEHNYSLLKKEDWSGVVLKEADRIEILRFVGGG